MRSRGTAASALQDRNGGDTGDMGGSKKMGIPQNGWFVRKNPITMDDLGPIKMDDLGVPLILGNPHVDAGMR